MLRLFREPGTGRPAPGTRLVALLIVVGLVAAGGSVLVPVLRWVLSLI